MTHVAIIDYGSGNLRSVAKAFEHVADGAKIEVARNPNALKSATHIVLPGVGAFADCMAGLSSLDGMLDALREEVQARKKPFLGICVGMQMLFERGHAHGVHSGLGWLKGEVKPLAAPGLKIPHMGWNELNIQQQHPLLTCISSGAHAYFVHSFAASGADSTNILATCDYGQSIVSVVAHENMMGTQFHPEKSQETGLRLLKNFMEI